jgi:hypothetical protein
MAWFKVDDGFHASRKLLKIPKRSRFAAAGLWSIAGSWAADQLTDGHVPNYMIAEWAPPPAAPDALVDAGLWERTQDGFAFYNWHEYQPSKQDVDAERAASRERMRELRAKRKGPKPLKDAEEGDVFGRTVPNGSESVRNPDPTRPSTDPTHKEEAKASSETAIRNDFTDWYIEYPRKASRGLAEKAYIKARKKATADELLDGARRYAGDPNREQEFTKLPATWLNAGSWDDEPLPARGASFTASRPDHSSRARAKEAEMLTRLAAQQEPFLEIEG